MKKEDIKLLKKLLCDVHEKSYDKTAMFIKMYNILEYFEDDKTPEFYHKIEKEYNIKKGVE